MPAAFHLSNLDFQPVQKMPTIYASCGLSGESRLRSVSGFCSPSERERFAFPGIWQRWKGPIKKDALTTTTPNALTDSINHKRMPVLLTKEDKFETWLSGSPEEAFALARNYDPKAMRIVQGRKDNEPDHRCVSHSNSVRYCAWPSDLREVKNV